MLKWLSVTSFELMQASNLRFSASPRSCLEHLLLSFVPWHIIYVRNAAVMASNTGSRRRHTDYTVACICPMGIELAPVEAMLDEIYETLPTIRDQNAYTLGEIG